MYRRHLQRCDEHGFDELGEFIDEKVEVSGALKPYGTYTTSDGQAARACVCRIQRTSTIDAPGARLSLDVMSVDPGAGTIEVEALWLFPSWRIRAPEALRRQSRRRYGWGP